MRKGVLLLVFVLVVAVVGWLLFDAGSNSDVIPDEEIFELVEAANLEAVGTYTGGGIATRIYIQPDGPFRHTVSAEISDPVEGKFYEGWLVGGFGFVSTGKMVKDGDKYVLEFESNDDMTSYGKVVITEETAANGLDGKPEAHVLEGSF